jgi:hypothetical protein
MNKTSTIIIGALVLAFAVYAYFSERRVDLIKAESSFYERESERRQDTISKLKDQIERFNVIRDSLKKEHTKIQTDEQILQDPSFLLLDSSATWQDVQRAIAGPTDSD